MEVPDRARCVGKSPKIREEAAAYQRCPQLRKALDALKRRQKEPAFIDARLMYADLNLQMERYSPAEEASEQALPTPLCAPGFFW